MKHALCLPRTVFMGSPEFALPSLRGLIGAGYPIVGVYTQPDRPVRRGRELVDTPPPVKRLAQSAGLPVFQPERLRGPAIDELEGLASDLIVVAAYGLILPRRILALPRHGCVNVHASLLPRHRGAAPISGAILSGDPETGVTLMLLDAGIDTGPLIARAAEPIRPDDTTGTLTPRLADLGADLLARTLPEWIAGTIEPEAQDESLATYWPMVKREDARLDWRRPAAHLERAVRAFQPWPVAYTTWAGREIRVLAGSVLPEVAAAPGEVVDGRNLAAIGVRRAPVIGTGEGGLALLKVQPAGGRPVDGASFLNGHPGIVGARLES